MAVTESTVSVVQQTLQAHTRPRDEVQHIRRVLAHQLRANCTNGPRDGPLALVDASCVVKSDQDAQGLRLEYLHALRANNTAKREYDRISNLNDTSNAAREQGSGRKTRLASYVATLKAKDTLRKLQVIEKHLDILQNQPAAAHNFLQDLGLEFPPQLSSELIGGPIDNSENPGSGAATLIESLEKMVLRARLLLEKEQRLLEQVRHRQTAPRRHSQSHFEFSALLATRDRLVSWIEGELGDGLLHHQEQENAYPSTRQLREQMDVQLELIREKYGEYLVVRKQLVEHVVPIANNTDVTMAHEEDGPGEQPQTFGKTSSAQILPPLQALLDIEARHRAIAAQDAQIQAMLSKKASESRQAAAARIKRNQLLQGRSDAKTSIMHDQSKNTAEGLGLTTMTAIVRPVIAAADAAKLATLEHVADELEQGQMSLEQSMQHLDELRKINAERDQDPWSKIKGDNG